LAVLLFLSVLLFVPILNTAFILNVVLAATFMAELLVKLCRAVAWRIVENVTGAHNAVFLLLTATITMAAIYFRIKF
jgi:hypothetical protein